MPATCPCPQPDQSSPCPPTAHFLKIHLNIILPSTSGSLAQVSPPKSCILLSPIRSTCPAHLMILDFIIRTIFGEQYRSLSSSLCSFLHSPVTPSLLAPNILLKHPVLKHPQPTFLPQCERPSFTSIQNNRQNYSSVYLDL